MSTQKWDAVVADGDEACKNTLQITNYKDYITKTWEKIIEIIRKTKAVQKPSKKIILDWKMLNDKEEITIELITFS